jgi:hypothetical protein
MWDRVKFVIVQNECQIFSYKSKMYVLQGRSNQILRRGETS